MRNLPKPIFRLLKLLQVLRTPVLETEESTSSVPDKTGFDGSLM